MESEKSVADLYSCLRLVLDRLQVAVYVGHQSSHIAKTLGKVRTVTPYARERTLVISEINIARCSSNESVGAGLLIFKDPCRQSLAIHEGSSEMRKVNQLTRLWQDARLALAQKGK